jgi:hypothetical protein
MSTISLKTTVLGKRLAAHLLRRTTYNFNKQRINEFALKTPSEALAILMADYSPWRDKPWVPTLNGPYVDVSGPGTVEPNRGKNGKVARHTVSWWLEEARRDTTIHHKMITFLHQNFMVHNRFAKPQCFYDYLKYLQYYSLGSYKELAKKISVSSTMLMYLNGNGSKKNNPNENYAREYFELFTIGKGEQVSADDFTTYTEYDVKQAAKIFTGWRRSFNRNQFDTDTNIPRGFFRKKNHDTTTKVFSAAFNNTSITGGNNLGGALQEIDDLTEMIFAQDATAKNIVRKLYRFFIKSEISPNAESSFITPLANKLKSDNYDLFDTIETLLSSQHFYDEDDNNPNDEAVGALIKPPKELMDHVINYFGVTIPDNQYKHYQRVVPGWLNITKMKLGYNDSVSGYDGYFLGESYDKNWYTLDTAEARLAIPKSFLDGRNRVTGNKKRKLFGNIKIDIMTWVNNPNNISNPSNAETIVDELFEGLFPETPSTSRKSYFLNTVFLQGLSPMSWWFEWQNYQETGDETEVKQGLYNLLSAILQSPEFQTM